MKTRESWTNCSLYDFVVGLFSGNSNILYRPLEIQSCNEDTKLLLWYFLERAGYKCTEQVDTKNVRLKRVYQNYSQEREIEVREYHSPSFGDTTVVLECNEILPF